MRACVHVYMCGPRGNMGVSMAKYRACKFAKVAIGLSCKEISSLVANTRCGNFDGVQSPEWSQFHYGPGVTVRVANYGPAVSTV